MKRLLPVLLLLGLSACSRQKAGPYAVLETSMGPITIELLPRQAPKTVAHFIALATGKKEWTDPRSGKKSRAPLYDGVTFHRVIPGFMIQTGDPAGDGQGDIGVTVEDEVSPATRYDRPGLVGLANFGPGTGAGQFFITLGPGPDLDGRNALFGQVVDGLDVARAISRVPRNEMEYSNRPLKPVLLRRLVIRESL